MLPDPLSCGGGGESATGKCYTDISVAGTTSGATGRRHLQSASAACAAANAGKEALKTALAFNLGLSSSQVQYKGCAAKTDTVIELTFQASQLNSVQFASVVTSIKEANGVQAGPGLNSFVASITTVPGLASFNYTGSELEAASNQPPKGKKSNLPLVVGLSVAGAVVALTIVAAAIVLVMRTRSKKPQVAPWRPSAAQPGRVSPRARDGGAAPAGPVWNPARGVYEQP